MRKTLLEIQRLLNDIRGDTALFSLTLTTNKVERALQLLEGAIRDTAFRDTLKHISKFPCPKECNKLAKEVLEQDAKK